MRILRIVLQNINSLRSNAPVIIDFESEKFNDIGLYAITGATGAGKTTVLDAITIALYHSVPRFKGNKGALKDVVSYGANHAYSRVQFENEGVVYEASWAMRLASGTGKRLKNPQEEVSLKNLSENKIMASQKRQVISEVSRVTQLDYGQFLRSVMLAQGEFASFLVAKGADKGRLLEQITGEDIYKKIGEGVQERKAKEENHLKEIQAKINAEDILTDGRRQQLTERNKVLERTITVLEKQFETQQRIALWYGKQKENTENIEKLTADKKQLDDEAERYGNVFSLLAQDEKATPFREVLKELLRNEKDLSEKTEYLYDLKETLKILAPKIEALSTIWRKNTEDLTVLNQDFKNWLPKLDQVTKLDADLAAEHKNLKTKRKNKEESDAVSISLETERKELTDTRAGLVLKIEKEEVFLNNNGFLTEVSAKLSNWTKNLTHLVTKRSAILDGKKAVELLKRKQEKNKTLLLANNKELYSADSTINRIEKEITIVDIQLVEKDLSTLLAKEKEQQELALNWNKLKVLAESKSKNRKTLEAVLKDKGSSSLLLQKIANDTKNVELRIETQEKRVADATKILDLEKSIAKYEDDRHHLVNGEPCGLCGATSHPYTNGMTSRGVSDAVVALDGQKSILTELTGTLTDYGIQQAKLNTTIESYHQQVETIEQEIKTLNASAIALNMDVSIDAIEAIDDRSTVISETQRTIGEAVIEAQELQLKKNALAEKLTEGNKRIGILKANDATFNSELRNTEEQVVSKSEEIENTIKEYTTIATLLKIDLKPFGYQLPSAENTSDFIKGIEENIDAYNNRSKAIETIRSKVAVSKVALDGNLERSTALKEQIKELSTSIEACTVSLSGLKVARMAILPMETTVGEKRNSLQLAIERQEVKVASNKEDLEKAELKKTEKETIVASIRQNREELDDTLTRLNAELESLIVESDFESREAVEKSLLAVEDRNTYLALKADLKDRNLTLETLIKERIKIGEQLKRDKDFDVSIEENTLALEEFKIKKQALSEEKGEIREAFKKDQEIKDRNSEIYKRIEAQEVVCNVWRSLYKVIGGSKEAFNIYVQRLTLKHLLDLANVHLYNLNPRYSLKMERDYNPREELDFSLIDHYQTDKARLVDTSSGGEKFIISLALALGLSDLASKNVKIDSLFIDEGFGTLDSATLETVISTLETLRSQGKTIGIISHVENLKERIPTQIKVMKKSNGVSVLEIS